MEVRTYLVSGIWTDKNGNPKYYCIHQLTDKGVSTKKKIDREQMIGILTRHNTAMFIFQWDYSKGCFVQGQEIQLVQGVSINTDPPSEEHKELKHLIRINWFE